MGKALAHRGRYIFTHSLMTQWRSRAFQQQQQQGLQGPARSSSSSNRSPPGCSTP